MIEIICEKWTHLQYRKTLTDIKNKIQLPKGKGGEGPIERFVTDNSAVKNLSANAGDAGSISRSGRSLGAINGHPLQYSCLGNPMDRGTWRATVHGVSKSQTCEWLTLSLSLFPSTGFMLSYCHCQFSRQWHLHMLLNYSAVFLFGLVFLRLT